jgi:RNA polymerase sigma-70 factor (ECF subfamily)
MRPFGMGMSTSLAMDLPFFASHTPSAHTEAASSQGETRRRRRKVSDSRQAEMDEDMRLVARAKAQDQAAFRQLVQRYQQRCLAVALGMLRSRDDAADVVQDAFIKAYRNLDRFEGNSSFYTWLYRIVVNLCIDARRKVQRSRTDQLDETVPLDQERAASLDVSPWRPGAHPGSNAQDRELALQISRGLERLSENHRAILVLREVDGLSYEELAETLKISKGTVMSRLFHARQNMQRMLRAELGLREGQLPSGAMESEEGTPSEGKDG